MNFDYCFFRRTLFMIYFLGDKYGICEEDGTYVYYFMFYFRLFSLDMKCQTWVISNFSCKLSFAIFPFYISSRAFRPGKGIVFLPCFYHLFFLSFVCFYSEPAGERRMSRCLLHIAVFGATVSCSGKHSEWKSNFSCVCKLLRFNDVRVLSLVIIPKWGRRRIITSWW